MVFGTFTKSFNQLPTTTAGYQTKENYNERKAKTKTKHLEISRIQTQSLSLEPQAPINQLISGPQKRDPHPNNIEITWGTC